MANTPGAVARFRIEGGELWYGESVLGPASALYADYQEAKGADEADGVVHRVLPHRIDFLFVAGEKVVGVEGKRPSDLLSSWSSRRLHRQMRVLLQCCDVAGLLLRPDWPTEELWEGIPMGLYRDLVRLQCLGVVLVPGPVDDTEVVQWLTGYRSVLAGGRNLLAAVAGTDIERERQPGWYLRRIPGVGPILSDHLTKRFGSVRVALLASDEEWQECGANSRALKGREEALQ